ncbi:MAG: hypothetical protein KatS3mg053_0118 [Candidatus Roseilinea sp.]|nr:MAG: hypothetical protein KatS3mg053_0118 [Candidatus Roseilinea sp.]
MAACAECMRMHGRRLYRHAYEILRDQYEAEDIVQETYFRAFRAIRHFEGNASLGTWLYRIVHNASLERLRYRKRQAEITEADLSERNPSGGIEDIGAADEPTDYAALDDFIENQEFRAQLSEAIASLPKTLRQVLVMRDLDGLSVLETSERLCISPSAVKVRLHRARAKLREKLGEKLKEYYQ